MSNAHDVRATLQLADGIAAAAVPADHEVRAWVEAALDAAGYDHDRQLEVTLRVVLEEESAALNATYRGKDGPTNILAFTASAPPLPPETLPEQERELGDLVLCLAVAEREAAQQGKRLPQHLAHLIVHGTLHLAGHDHADAAGAEVMEGLERAVLERFGVPDPYADEDR